MTDSVLPPTTEVAPSAAALSVGATLKAEREKQGLHIAALSVALRISVKKIEALEADQFDLLPDLVFVRALASSICRTLKIDPVPILQRLPPSAPVQLNFDETSLNTAFRAPGEAFSIGSVLSQVSRPVVIAVFVLLAAAVLLYAFPFRIGTESTAGIKPETTAPPAPFSSVPAVDTPVAAPALSEPAIASVASPSLPLTSASAALADGLQASVTVPGTGTTSGVLVLKARAVSWVSVIDAKGEVQLRKNLLAGEVAGVSGATPLTVVIGRTDAVEVLVRGKPFDLNTVAKNSVAHFEVK